MACYAQLWSPLLTAGIAEKTGLLIDVPKVHYRNTLLHAQNTLAEHVGPDEAAPAGSTGDQVNQRRAVQDLQGLLLQRVRLPWHML